MTNAVLFVLVLFACLPTYMFAEPCPLLFNPPRLVTMRSPRLICLVSQIYGPNGLVSNSLHGPLVNTPWNTMLQPGASTPGFYGAAGLNPLSTINSEIGTQLSQLPAASPVSGLIFAFNPSLGVADVVNLRNFPASYFPLLSRNINLNCSIPGTPGCVNGGGALFASDTITTQNRVDLKIHEVTALALFGLTNRLDISVAVPILHIGLSMTSTATINSYERAPYDSNPVADPFSCNNNPAPGVIGCMNQFSTTTVHGQTLLPITNPLLGHNQAVFTSAGSALGVGDVIFRGKFQAIKRERTGLAIGLDLHAPTGAETDFLGSGAWGVRPFAAFSYSGRVAPHASLGYQINSNSVLAGVLTPGTAGHLPNVVSYDAGVDAGVSKWISLSAEFLGQSLLKERAPSGLFRLLQLHILRFGFFQDGDVGVGVFPDCEEIFVGGAGFSRVALQCIGAGELEMGKGAE